MFPVETPANAMVKPAWAWADFAGQSPVRMASGARDL